MSLGCHQQIQVLHVDDEPGFADLTKTSLERKNDHLRVETATSVDEGLQYIADHSPDCVVSDYDMPGMDGINFLRAVRERDPNLPFILFTGNGSEEIASDAISAGVTDYLQKESGPEQYDLLTNRIRNSVRARREARRFERQEELMRITESAGNIGGWELTIATGQLTLTPGARRLLDAECRQMPFDRFLDFCHPDDRDEIRAAVDSVIDTQEQLDRTWRFQSADDVHRQVNMTMIPVTTGDEILKIRGAINDITEHKHREQRLSQYRDLLENINDAVFVVDQNQQIVYANRQSLVNVDLKPQEIEHKPIMPFIEQYAASRSGVVEFKQALATALNGCENETPDSVELTVTAGESESVYQYRFSRVSSSLRFNSEEVSKAVAIVARDITDRRQRDQKLEQTQEFMSKMEELANIGAWEYDPETGKPTHTTGELQIYGVDPESSLTLDEALEFYHPEDRHQLKTNFRECIETGEPYEMDVRVTRTDGEQRWVTAQGQRIQQQDTQVVRGYVQDITARKERMNALEQIETLFENAQDMLFIIEYSTNNDEFVVKRVNHAFQSATGLSNDDLQGKTPQALFGEARGQKIEDKYRRCLETGQSLHYEETLAEEHVPHRDSPIDDGLVYWETHITPVKMDGDVDWIVGSTRDVNKQKRRQQELERRNERLDEFTSIISHDLRNPLSVAEGYLELARSDCESDHLINAVKAVDRCQVLIDDLLTLAHEDNQISETDAVALADIAEQSWQTVATNAAVLNIETEQRIQADSGRLQQLFENLYRNAVEHGGEDVTVHVTELDNGFCVADTGRGIPKTERETVFKSGYSTNENGTGFGLRIVEQIAEAHGWTVAVTESEDGGARFEITGVEYAEC